METPTSSLRRAGRKALVLIPGAVNYFYNLCGRRLAETLRELSFAVDVCTLADHPAGRYDWCVLSNISEVLHGYGDYDAALTRLRALKKSCGVMTSAAIDSVATPWYQNIRTHCRAAGIETILDFSLHDQRGLLAEDARATYHYLPAGLTTAELRGLDDERGLDDGRTIPWAFVGHHTPDRTALVDYLVRKVDPRGFVYIPRLAPYQEKDSPHLNEQQFDAVLRRTRYQIWSSHHHAFYMESERFRMSLLAGGVPVKVLCRPLPPGEDAPFSYLMVEQAALAGRLGSFDFHEVRRRFRDDFRRVQTLRAGLAEFLAAVSVLDRREVRTLVRDRWWAARAA
jgi:hypothetical protein